MGWFKTKPLVDEDEFAWLVACFAWIHRRVAGRPDRTGWSPHLVTARTAPLCDAGSASAMFEAIAGLTGFGDQEFDLEQAAPRHDAARLGTAGRYSERSALATFQIVGNVPLIRYDPALLYEPASLAATFAHELAHMLLHDLGDPPGGSELSEHATDCAAVYLGFGIFLANSARSFTQFQHGTTHGWQSQTRGYLSERALLTLLALFVRLRSFDGADVPNHLKTYLRGDFEKALRHVVWRFPDVATSLAELDLADWA